MPNNENPTFQEKELNRRNAHRLNQKRYEEKQKEIIFEEIKKRGFPRDSIIVYRLDNNIQTQINTKIKELNKIPKKTHDQEAELKKLIRERHKLTQQVGYNKKKLILNIAKEHTSDEETDEETDEKTYDPAKYEKIFQLNPNTKELVETDGETSSSETFLLHQTSQIEESDQWWRNQSTSIPNSSSRNPMQSYVETDQWDSQFPGNIVDPYLSSDIPAYDALNQWWNPLQPPVAENLMQHAQTYPWNLFPHYPETPNLQYGTSQTNINSYYITNNNNIQIFQNPPTEHNSAEPNTRNQFQNPGSDRF